jgi:hypothetical protein
MAEMTRLKKQFDSQQEKVGARVGTLAKSFAERAAALAADYARELHSMIVECGVSSTIADAIVAAESKRIDTDGVRPADAFGAVALRANVMRELGSQQFGSVERFELEKRVIYAQAVVRGWLVRKRFRNLVNRQKRREHAAKELLSTERTYADGLRIMVECYIQPFMILTDTVKEIISANDIKILFSNCRQLSMFHAQMLEKLSNRLGNYNGTTTRLGDVFVELAPFFKVYQEYVNNYDTAQKHLVELKKNNARFAETLADIEKSPASAGKDLLSYLITPVQRVPRYEMMLAEIVKLTPDDHVDSAALRTALDGIKKAAVGINEAKRKAESSQRMTNLAQQLQGIPPSTNFHLLQPHRRYLFEGMLLIKDDNKLKEVLLFLFNDVLIVGRPKSKFAVTNVANAIANNEFRYSDFVQCKRIIKLDTCQVSLGDTKELSRALDIRHGARLEKQLRCYADDAADISAWQQRLQAAIQAHMQKLANSTLRSRPNDPDNDADEFEEFDADDDPAALVRTESTQGSELYRTSSSMRAGGAAADPADLLYLQRGKLRDVIRLYEDAVKLQESIFDMPIHLKNAVAAVRATGQRRPVAARAPPHSAAEQGVGRYR